ncbi:hypothetical protein LJR143_001859 [Pseudoxanthomonas sp. LjRoot143]|uniref:hypothetical protein n=1 Tax=Pseudoxanthomonas sp. LjRoot143 TaxID=3342266 RepID=UPI003ECCBE53
MAKLLEQHVDDVSSNFAILGTANNLKDYAKSYFAGTVAAGIAYLAMVKDGYVWCDHFENLGGGKTGLKKSPDFVFACPSHGVALVEAKGTRGSASKVFDGTVRGGYEKQVEPHLGFGVGGVIASHGYCIGAHMRSSTKATLHVHHTEVSAATSTGFGNEISPETAGSIELVQRNNYATVLNLVHSDALGRRLRSGQGKGSINFTRFSWRGRDWLGPPLLARSLINKRRLSPGVMPEHFFALDEAVAHEVLTRFLYRSSQSQSTNGESLQALDFVGRSFEVLSDGAIYPDGMAIVSFEAEFEVSRSGLFDGLYGGKSTYAMTAVPDAYVADKTETSAIERELVPNLMLARVPRLPSSD